jgi:hypothetical protein
MASGQASSTEMCPSSVRSRSSDLAIPRCSCSACDRGALDQAGLAGPEDAILAGNQAELEKAVRRFADAGATELQLCPVGPPAEQARTIEFFGELARRTNGTFVR